MVKKPVISYVATPGRTTLNISIVLKKLSKTSYRNWKDKAEFTDFVDTLYVPPKSNCYVFVRCQCLTEYIYGDKTEIPENSKICDVCGRKVIEYGGDQVFEN